MGHLDPQTTAERTGCKIILKGLTLQALNQLLHSNHSSENSDYAPPLFADFSLGQRLSAVAVIGTRDQLNQLKLELAL
jgi:hypothetical protein